MEPHVAVLTLDTPIKTLAEVHGDFGDNAVALLRGLALPVVKYQIAYQVTPDDNPLEAARVEQTFAQLAEYAALGVLRGVVLLGSRSDSFAQGNPWIDRLDHFIQHLLYARAGIPLVGLCFGHQILAKNLGCKVFRNSADVGWEAGTTTIALNKSIFDIPQLPFRALRTDSGLLEHINLVEFHRDIVYALPPPSTHPLLLKTSFQSVGSTPKCSIQGLITESGPIKLLSFQGHPEFTTPEALRILEIDVEQNTIDKALFEKLTYNTKCLVNQGPEIGRVIRTFIETHQNIDA